MQAFRNEVKLSHLTSETKDMLTIGGIIERGHFIFELYIPGKTSEDAIVLAKAIVMKNDGSVKCEVFEHPM